MSAPVTPAGVRDGDPAALAGLCAARGPSVLAYCHQVAGADAAGEAAAAAFGRFRAAVAETADLGQLNPEALLINATRRAAAARAARAPMGVCAVVPLLLVTRADNTITDADRALLEQHLATCAACRAPVARFEAAERAYREPPDPAIDPLVVAQIIAAMAAAAPIRRPEPTPAPPLQNGGAHVPVPAPEAVEPEPEPPAVPPPPSARDQPTTEFRPPDVVDPEPAAVPATAIGAPAEAGGGADAPRTRVRRTRRSAGAAPTAAAAAGAGPARPRRRRRRPRRAAGAAQTTAAAGPGAGLARPSRAPARGGSRVSVRPRGDGGRRRRLPIFLPVAVVLAAVLVALFVSGVFGGSDPASSPRVDAPADTAPATTPADVVVVPGAEEASPDDVEEAKARERARAQRRREAAAARASAARARPAASPPAATPPPVAVAPPPPPPPPAQDSDSGSSRRIDAGNGATGAEQIPPAQDTSTVPDLAPPPEQSTSP